MKRSRQAAPFLSLTALALLTWGCGSTPGAPRADGGPDAPQVSGTDGGLDTATKPDDSSGALAADGAPTDAGTVKADTADPATGDAAEVGDAQDASADAASDGGLSGAVGWVALQEPIGASMGSLAFDGDGNLYAGGLNVGSTLPGAGIFVSPDEGVSWRPVNRGLTTFEVAAMAATGKTIFAGTKNLMRSQDGGASWSDAGPRSSVGHLGTIAAQGALVAVASSYGGDSMWVSSDGGKTFKQSMYAAQVTDLAVVGSVIVRAGPAGVDRSTDMGITFAAVQGITKGDGKGANLRCDGVKTCYASAHEAGQFDPPVIFRSTDAGATWTSTGKVSFQVLAVGDASTVYVRPSNGTAIERSDDGGATWSTVFRPTTRESFAPDCDGPYLARGTKLFAVCRDGVYRSDDRGAHWVWAGGSGATGAITGRPWIALADTSSTALGPNGDLYVSSGVSPRIHFRRSSDDGKTWTELTAPSVGRCLVMEKGALQCTGTRGIYDEFIFQRSEDHGATWKEIAVYPPAMPPPVQRPFLGIIARRGPTLYAVGKDTVARSDDDGLTFQLLPGVALPFLSDLQILRSGHLLAGDSTTGDVQRSTDRGATWQKLKRGFRLPVLEDDTGRLLSYGSQGDLTASTDEGDTWSYLSNTGLPYASGGGFALPAIDGAGRFYLLTALTLYASGDHGATWEPLPAPLPNPNVSTFFTDRKGRLLAATSGGIYRME